MDNKIKRYILMGVLSLIFIAVTLISLGTGMSSSKVPEVKDYKRWDSELTEEFATMVIQDGERLKPFSTFAAFKLYGIHAKRVLNIKVDGKLVKLSPTEWAMDCIFRPEVADELPLFRIDDDRILRALGVTYDSQSSDKKKRDVYSYNELFVGEFAENVEKEKARIQKLEANKHKLRGIDVQIKNLTQNIDQYTALKNTFLGIRSMGYRDQLQPELDALRSSGAFPDEYSTGELTSVQKAELNTFFELNLMTERYRRITQMSVEERASYKPNQLDQMVMAQMDNFQNSFGLELRTMPSVKSDVTKWYGWQVTLSDAMRAGEIDTFVEGVKDMVRWSAFFKAYSEKNEAKMLESIRSYKELAAARADKHKIDLTIVEEEYAFYKQDYFYKALLFFLGGCLTILLMLPSPHSKFSQYVYWVTIVLSVVGLAYLMIGIVYRAVLMERYPLGNLYDTILFTSASAVMVLLFVELITKRRVCLGLAVVMGALGMFLGYAFEVGNASDHMTPLNAVLRSNFWLSTHVTTIVIGYAGGLVAAIMSVVYLLGRLTGVDEGSKSHRRFMTRIVYGACCFTLLFSLVGTILGGVWANDSWGRFWGWDPKENGALMIVLWYLIILHARMGGYIKEWGLHICAVFGANIVAFSWWGVNFLSVGLHSYGFASGSSGAMWLMCFIILNTAIVVLAIAFAWYEKGVRKQRENDKLKLPEDHSQPQPPEVPIQEL